MDTPLTLPLSDPLAALERVGGKGASLARLAQAGLPVPAGFTITTAAYRLFVGQNDLQAGILEELKEIHPDLPATYDAAAQRIRERFLAAPVPSAVQEAILAAYGPLRELGPVAIRSSATAEDLPEASFAGQQETYLNIRGDQAVLDATRSCWASLWTARAMAYRARQGIAPGQVALAVVVQQLVDADASGVLFTANPVNGRRDQLIVNAAWGLGEAIVGGLVTPDSYTLDRATGQVSDQAIADKQVMTVRQEDGTREQPVPEPLRRAPALSQPALSSLYSLALKIEALYGAPMDIEWALAGGQVAILQARPITALPEATTGPDAAPSIVWTLPNPKGRYSRGSIADFMPAPLTPLFESMVVPGMNQALFERMQKIGKAPLQMYRRFFTTINHFLYTSATFRRRDWLQMILHLFPAVPRMMRDGLSYWRDEALPQYQEVTGSWHRKDLGQLSAGELVSGIEEIFAAAAYHLATLQISTLGIAAGAEGLFTAIYNKWIKRPGDPDAPTFLMGFDSTPIQAEKSLFDLATACQAQPPLAQFMRQAATAEIIRRFHEGVSPDGVDPAGWAAFRQQFQAHLDRFGYAIYNLDFTQPLPLDDPGPMLETIRLYLGGQGKNPHERQQAASDRREAAARSVLSRVKGFKASAFRKTLRWAQKFGPLREDSIAEIGLGYPVLRALIHELGCRLAQAGQLQEPRDIYWLEWSEVKALAEALGETAQSQAFTLLILKRKAEHLALKRITPPAQLPGKIKFLGLNTDVFLGVHEGNEEGSLIRGLGASAGQVTATARVLNGPEDFHQMRPGDVLVAAITTPAWTPLFAMASAVVTDIGGPLSHGSIVAREYGIPAVLGTGSATRLIRSGQRVTVDGTQGTVTLFSLEEG